MARTVPIDDVRPSQLYVSSAKLASVVGWFDFDDPNYGTLPILECGDGDVPNDGDYFLTDGHTRAFVAYLSGVEELRIARDETEFDLTDRLLYRECLGWCAEANVTTVGDLAGRVLAPETFEEQWVGRCRRAAERLTE